jgi:hypothetical protein
MRLNEKDRTQRTSWTRIKSFEIQIVPMCVTNANCPLIWKLNMTRWSSRYGCKIWNIYINHVIGSYCVYDPRVILLIFESKIQGMRRIKNRVSNIHKVYMIDKGIMTCHLWKKMVLIDSIWKYMFMKNYISRDDNRFCE